MLLSTLKNKTMRHHILFSWGLAILLALLIIFATGGLYGIGEGEAREIIDTLQSSSLYYGAAIITSSATILALMITILSMAYSSDEDFEDETYTNLKAIALLCVISFIGGVALLFFISFPVKELDKINNDYIIYFFYAITIWNGLLAGHMISVILILKNIAMATIDRFNPNLDND